MKIQAVGIDLLSAVKELEGLSSQELGKLIRDSENNVLQCITGNGSSIQIDVEQLARYLPLHLIAVLMSSAPDEELFRYLLRGLRLLHSLSDIASRHPKLEQMLLDDVKVSEQLLDLIFYFLIVLGGYRQEVSCSKALLHSALVACSLCLLTGLISSQWQELVQVLVAHPKVDIFMHVAFAAVCVSIKFLQIKLSDQHTDSCVKSESMVEKTLNHLCQQCEASLQFLLSLCQQKLFRERLVKNKELCGKGGVLLLAQAIMNLKVSPSVKESSSITASVSRLKSKILSILLHLFEAESVSYLDEVASSTGSLELAQAVALEVLELLKKMFHRDPKQPSACSDKSYPKGLLQLNAMRLTDVFSDDSNFRSYITIYFTEVLTSIFSLPHGEFLSSWCSSDLPVSEEDATLEYDAFASAGWILDLSSSSNSLIDAPEPTFITCNLPRASYAHQRTSLLVKVIANLHCFAPDICKEEKDLFLNKFLQCLQKEFPKSSDGFSSSCDAEKAIIVTRNLCSLVSHAESLIPSFLNEEDVRLLRTFFSQLDSLITPAELEVNRLQENKFEGTISWDKVRKPDVTEEHKLREAKSTGGRSSPLQKRVAPDLNISGNLKEGTSDNSAFAEVDQIHAGNDSIGQTDGTGRQDMLDKGKPRADAIKDFKEIPRDSQNVETSGSDSSSTRGKDSIVKSQTNKEFSKSMENIKQSGPGVQIHKVPRKRKRTIMNDEQIALIENALLNEPRMQRNAASIQSWADKLSFYGSEVTSSQLKNWLNNRKARLARAAKDIRASSEGDNQEGPRNMFSSSSPLSNHDNKQAGPGIVFSSGSPESSHDKQGVPRIVSSSGSHESNHDVQGSPESRVDGVDFPLTSTKENIHKNGGNSLQTGNRNSVSDPSDFAHCQSGQHVLLVDGQGAEIGKGKVHQVQGKWYGRNLDESETCVVDIFELKIERWARIPYPSEATGTSFDQAEKKLGIMRVLWDSNRLYMLQPL